MELLEWHREQQEAKLSGRYITLQDIEPLLKQYEDNGEVSVIGRSVNKDTIYMYRTGQGPKRVLMWSQMHGNESTTTKAVMDLLKFLKEEKAVARCILEQCTLYIIPMLNPDGARAYTRVNAVNIDLNRDAADISQPESFALRRVFDEIAPDFCFNLHDQRTIFNTGDSPKPATLSFLSPATNKERSITPPRKKSMEVIAAINTVLQRHIPGQVGRYDDSFNINCVGDSFQTLGVPTLLFEAGHYPEDYNRDITRQYVFRALLAALQYVADHPVSGEGYEAYFDIPENGKQFFDILIREFPITIAGEVVRKDIGILYKEELRDHKIVFTPYIEEIGDLQGFYGHKTYSTGEKTLPSIEEKNLETSTLLKLFL